MRLVIHEEDMQVETGVQLKVIVKQNFKNFQLISTE